MKTDGQPHTPGTDGSGGQRRAGKGSEKRNDIMVARGFTFCVYVWPEGFAREGQTLLEAQGWLVESTFRSHFSLLHCDRSSVCLSFSFSLSLNFCLSVSLSRSSGIITYTEKSTKFCLFVFYLFIFSTDLEFTILL